jgi:hypothetical protein
VRIARLFLPLLLLLATAATAHHSTANFDRTRQESVTGTVKFFGFTNPHSFIDLDVTDAKGKTEQHKVFLPGRVLLTRYNWKPGDLKAGDKVTITGNPDRKDARFIYLLRVKFASGKEWERSKEIPE